MLAGDIIDSAEHAGVLAEVFTPFIKQGLQVVAVLGNHEHYRSNSLQDIKIAYQQAGIIVLENDIFILQKGRRKVYVVGLSQYPGYEVEQRAKLSMDSKTEIAEISRTRRAEVVRFLEECPKGEYFFLMHYAPIDQTVGTLQKNEGFGQGYGQVIDAFATRRRKVLGIVHGHHHGPVPREGSLEGLTEKKKPVFNVASAVRIREGLRPTKTFTF